MGSRYTNLNTYMPFALIIWIVESEAINLFLRKYQGKLLGEIWRFQKSQVPTESGVQVGERGASKKKSLFGKMTSRTFYGLSGYGRSIFCDDGRV